MSHLNRAAIFLHCSFSQPSIALCTWWLSSHVTALVFPGSVCDCSLTVFLHPSAVYRPVVQCISTYYCVLPEKKIKKIEDCYAWKWCLEIAKRGFSSWSDSIQRQVTGAVWIKAKRNLWGTQMFRLALNQRLHDAMNERKQGQRRETRGQQLYELDYTIRTVFSQTCSSHTVTHLT